MQITKDNPSSTSALDLSEIRSRIATFLDRKTCVSCMRVSRDWFKDFAPSVWHTIDCVNDDNAVSKFTPEILDKYGSFISEVLNIKFISNLRSIQHHKVNALEFIQVHPSSDHQYRDMISDLLLRCCGSLHALDIRCPAITFDEQREQSENYVRVADIIAMPAFSSSAESRITTRRVSCLRTLKLEYVCITREAFSTLLRGSPSLDALTLFQVAAIGHTASVPLHWVQPSVPFCLTESILRL